MLRLPNRGVIKIWGQDAAKFLHNITTNDVINMRSPHTIYNLMLNAKGRFLYDFFLTMYESYFLLECEHANVQPIVELIRLYRVNLRVKIRSCQEYVVAIDSSRRGTLLGETKVCDEGIIAFQDPRALTLGMRYLVPVTSSIVPGTRSSDNVADYDMLRITHTIPDCSVDMVSGESFALHFRLDSLNAISHTKGCYTGQEVTARMYRIGAKKKTYAVVAPCGTALPQKGMVTQGPKELGQLLSAVNNMGLCLLDTTLVSADSTGLQIAGINIKLHGSA